MPPMPALLLAALLLAGCAARAPIAGDLPTAASPAAIPPDVAGAAQRALAATVATDSVIRLEINERLPTAGAVRDRLVKVGLPWNGDDDWFGGSSPVPARWEIHIGERVDVAVAQAVIATCALALDAPFRVVFSPPDEMFVHESRVYIGSLDLKSRQPADAAAIIALLEPGITAAELHARARR
jgi:hypothetical protein